MRILLLLSIVTLNFSAFSQNDDLHNSLIGHWEIDSVDFDIVSIAPILNDTVAVNKLEKSFRGYMQFNVDSTFEIYNAIDKDTGNGKWELYDSGLFYMLKLIPLGENETTKQLEITIKEVKERKCHLAVLIQDGGAYGYINFFLVKKE